MKNFESLIQAGDRLRTCMKVVHIANEINKDFVEVKNDLNMYVMNPFGENYEYIQKLIKKLGIKLIDGKTPLDGEGNLYTWVDVNYKNIGLTIYGYQVTVKNRKKIVRRCK